jgi:hypothetical protein
VPTWLIGPQPVCVQFHDHIGKLGNFHDELGLKESLEETLLWKLSEPRSDGALPHESETERVFSGELFSCSASVFKSGWFESLRSDPALAGDEREQKRAELEALARDLVQVLARMRLPACYVCIYVANMPAKTGLVHLKLLLFADVRTYPQVCW